MVEAGTMVVMAEWGWRKWWKQWNGGNGGDARAGKGGDGGKGGDAYGRSSGVVVRR